jgi:hypothetical protein
LRALNCGVFVDRHGMGWKSPESSQFLLANQRARLDQVKDNRAKIIVGASARLPPFLLDSWFVAAYRK